MARGQFLDARVVVAELGQYLGSMLAEERWHARDGRALSVPLDRKTERAIVGDARVFAAMSIPLASVCASPTIRSSVRIGAVGTPTFWSRLSNSSLDRVRVT